jgi:lytic murein transglycosylase
MKQHDSLKAPTRRALLQARHRRRRPACHAAYSVCRTARLRRVARQFSRARPGKGISDATWTRVMGRIEPDMSVFRQMQKQPEFHEQIWQYINRRASDWRIINGREALKKHEALFARIEQDFGVERGTLLALWGVESAYGDPLVQQNHMRPIFPSLAALAWNEPRRRAYWETELINALKIVDRGWGTPEEMRGSWAGAMGHTQWMPEVWLNVGMDYDKDGRVSPFGKPDDALGSSARYLLNRGKYHRGEHWGYEVSASARLERQPDLRGMGQRRRHARRRQSRSRSRVRPHRCGCRSRVARRSCWSELLFGEKLQPVDELRAGDLPSRRPHSRRAAFHSPLPRLRARADACRSAGGADAADQSRLRHRRHRRPRRQRHHEGVKDYQTKMGLLPADGYGGLKVLARLRQGG